MIDVRSDFRFDSYPFDSYSFQMYFDDDLQTDLFSSLPFFFFFFFWTKNNILAVIACTKGLQTFRERPVSINVILGSCVECLPCFLKTSTKGFGRLEKYDFI